jgi:hypothetical protein
MTESLSADQADIRALRAELDRIKSIMQRQPQGGANSDAADALAASDFRRMTGPDLDVVPRSHPLGYLEGANWETRKRLELEAIAKSKGGRRDVDPVIASIYQHEWTAEEEHRWEFALGLRADVPPDPLDKPERPGSQNSQHPRTAAEAQARQGRRPAT